MDRHPPGVARAGARGTGEFGLVVLGTTLLTAALTYPLAFRMGTMARVDNGDGQFSIWNVAWVARTLVVDPRHLFDSNIFYPHRGTLAFSENNLGAGVLALPVYWATRNPYAANNFVIFVGFVLSAIGSYYLTRYLTGDRRAAVLSAVCFAFCGYAFAHVSQTQLELTAGLPFAMLAFHRLADRPSFGRGAVLGGVMAAQALCCGYYGVFAMCLVGYAICVVATWRSLWRNGTYWASLAAAAVIATALVAPAFIPYVDLHRTHAFGRDLEQARLFSANATAYLASPAYAHRWMLQYLPPWREVLFPGFLTIVLGISGLWLGRGIRRGEAVVLYSSALLLAVWASFGPAAGLYSVMYQALPIMSLLRAPARLGIVAGLCLAVLAGIAAASMATRVRRPNVLAAVLIVLAIGEHVVGPLQWPRAWPVEPVYRALAAQPRGPVIELPFYAKEVGAYHNAKYMLTSTAHWMPLVNGYSDYIPDDFRVNGRTLAGFPSCEALKILRAAGVRYAVVHLYGYKAQKRDGVVERLEQFKGNLRPIYTDDRVRLYEITARR